jgi:hypothetical protein
MLRFGEIRRMKNGYYAENFHPVFPRADSADEFPPNQSNREDMQKIRSKYKLAWKSELRMNTKIVESHERKDL